MHAANFFWLAYSHDSLDFIASYSERNWQISIGRYVQPVYWSIRGKIAAPLIVGLMSYLWLVPAVCIAADMFQLKSEVSRCLLSGIMTGSVALIATNATYIYLLDVFLFALLLNVLAAWTSVKAKGKWRFLTPVLVALSLGLYQAYLQVYVVAVMIWAVLEILDFGDGYLYQTMGSCLISAAYLVAGVALYYGTLMLVLKVTGIELSNNYNGLTGVMNYGGYDLVILLKETWMRPFEYLMKGIGKDSGLVAIARCVLLAIGVVSTLYMVIKKQFRTIAAGVIFLALALLPLGMNLIYFASKGMMHDLMIYSYCFADIGALAVSERAVDFAFKNKGTNGFGLKAVRVVACVVPIILSILIFDKAIYANQVYLKKKLEYDATQSMVVRVLDRLEQVDGYEAGETKVWFVGELNDSPIVLDRSGFSDVYRLTGTWSSIAVTYYSRYWAYCENILGYRLSLYWDEPNAPLQEIAQEMPCFPKNGSIQMVDGIAIVKISE